MSVEAQNLFKLHYGIKICNSTSRAKDQGYGLELGTRDKDPGPGLRSWTPVCIGLDSFGWLGPFGYCGLRSLLRSDSATL